MNLKDRSEGYGKGNEKECQDVEILFFSSHICNLVISNLATNLNGNVSKLCMVLNPSVLKLELIRRKGRRSVTVVIHTCFVLLFS